MTSVLLVTCALWPEGEPEGGRLISALAERDVDAHWVEWDDHSIDWAGADLVAVRSTWDYHRRPAEFLAWARRVEAVTTVLNGSDVFAWNADKGYLVQLAHDVPVVPTGLLDYATLVRGLAEAIEQFGTVVVKPRTGAGGVGVVIADSVHDERLDGLTAAPWVVQPLVESVRTSGETSVYVFAGRAVSQFEKSVAASDGGEIRVNEQHGGHSVAVPLGPEQVVQAEAAVRAAASRWDADLVYARVDLMRWPHDTDGWVVSELELIEPGLYLDVDPANAGPFADLVVSRL